ncbi:MAG: Crp/Fnr family transcriptional regulator [Ekhidna sp.]|uniref:Crp/Fnr family transcriptional regulator n=1 Tax=Ekhidna sp. TaxID=2608089 RepID=UPI0032EFEA70
MQEHIDAILKNTGLEPKLIDEIVTIGRLKKVSAGNVVISPDSPGNEMPIVLSGLLKVMRQDPDGNEVFLYYLEGGETCAMSITCCIEGRKASYKVMAEEDSTLWMIPMTYMDSWIKKYESFRRFVFGAYQTRFDELLMTIDSVVFHKMDERLYRYLLDTKQATGSYEIHKTHEQIANELNTSRVVISRLLKGLEREGKIEQHRNKIEIL